MRHTLAILAALTLPGCVTVSLDLPTHGGHATLTTDGEALFLGFKK